MKLAMLADHYSESLTEAGCDEAGRGCLAGPVVAAAVILERDFRNEPLEDYRHQVGPEVACAIVVNDEQEATHKTRHPYDG